MLQPFQTAQEIQAEKTSVAAATVVAVVLATVAGPLAEAARPAGVVEAETGAVVVAGCVVGRVGRLAVLVEIVVAKLELDRRAALVVGADLEVSEAGDGWFRHSQGCPLAPAEPP